MTTIRKTITAAVLAVALAAPGIAHADPNDGRGTGSPSSSVGDNKPGTGSPTLAPIDHDGTGSPSYNVPVEIPTVGDAPSKPKPGATPAEIAAYKQALAEHDAQVQAKARAEALEHARQEAQKAKKAGQEAQHRNDGGTSTADPQPWCPNGQTSCRGEK